MLFCFLGISIHQTAVLGWGLMFVLLGLCAFYWDRDLSIRQLQREKEARSKKEINWRVIVIRIVSLLGILAVGVYLGQLYANGSMPWVEVLLMAILLIFAIAILRCFIWYVTSLLKTSKPLPRLRFKLIHVLGIIGLMALFFGTIRMMAEQDETAFTGWSIAGFILLGTLISMVVYIGVDNLFFGYGSGKRVNRLRELEKDKEIRLPTRSNFSSCGGAKVAERRNEETSKVKS
ncbi:hypothetical protein [Bremerella sp.]|uniref:hypothetical protein n=1 Tax=Bremerella sp. TaxID=2795602 RepID=UPI00391BFF92